MVAATAPQMVAATEAQMGEAMAAVVMAAVAPVAVAEARLVEEGGLVERRLAPRRTARPADESKIPSPLCGEATPMLRALLVSSVGVSGEW